VVRKIKRMIEIWDCGDKSHTHDTETRARHCYNQREFPLRNIRVTVLVVEGATYAEAGRTIDVNAERARQIVAKAFREIRGQVHRRGDPPYPEGRGIESCRIGAEKEFWLKELALLLATKKHKTGTN